MIRLLSTGKTESPLNHDTVRLSGEVGFGNSETQIIWFDVPSTHADFMSERGDLWAVLLMPCAMVLGEDLQVDLPVDPLLLDNLSGVQKIWTEWYDWVRPVKLEAVEATDGRAARRGTAVCFSGGVDSYYSLLRSVKTGDSVPRYLFTMWGFDRFTRRRLDRPLHERPEYADVVAMGQECADRFNGKHVSIVTNLRELIGYRNWQFDAMTHSAALASMGHLLSNGIDEIIVGSSFDFSQLHPWGSHPLVDPLFGSAATRVVHDGISVNRVEKTEAVSGVPAALAGLRVCPRERSGMNCSKCSKCLRTMVTIDLVGQIAGAQSFDWSSYSLDKVSKTYLPSTSDMYFAREIKDAAEKRGRVDIARAIQREITRSRRLRPLDRGFQKLGGLPLFWRYAGDLRNAVLGYH